ncbi:hypothetical protein COY33_01060 [candidate division WWE3 bacterium CG_4_10_14_0_2_um_filter_42_7]|uniref:Uncharacterized protein n=1 Tax=candidate division WWE3 bacterium CG_4_10_14_0_2_um_filter_42_7 TaxID=1975073 RepID=A0A2M7TDX3_UNCKA|nr:MAG: hypothetical protein COY33_01060 [candidate division WWE3 bacterium CG_4_10_14_0_2_um_filter_42_7]
MGLTIIANTGPLVGDAMLFTVVNFIAFLVTLLFVLKIGTGKIGQPIFFIGLSFLVSALIPSVFGVENIWLVPLSQTFFCLMGILSLTNIFELFRVSKKEK